MIGELIPIPARVLVVPGPEDFGAKGFMVGAEDQDLDCGVQAGIGGVNSGTLVYVFD